MRLRMDDASHMTDELPVSHVKRVNIEQSSINQAALMNHFVNFFIVPPVTLPEAKYACNAEI